MGRITRCTRVRPRPPESRPKAKVDPPEPLRTHPARHGKEGVSGSSPEEGSRESTCIGCLFSPNPVPAVACRSPGGNHKGANDHPACTPAQDAGGVRRVGPLPGEEGVAGSSHPVHGGLWLDENY